MPVAPAGTFANGTRILVGRHKVIIERYLSEGGFAHVYLVKLVIDGVISNQVVVLKRVAVPDRDALTNMRTEVETMKKLRGQRYIVTYIDSHASQLKTGGFEVFLLMEYCAGGGLIDFMNTRLQNRLTEPEILHIFSDVAEGVACMHYLKPPLLHRDLKVENVLISSASDGSVRYKLCDFGSTAPPRPAPRSVVECRLIEDDVQKHTTLQYRSPEMVDVYRKLPIDEKSDIWALGVLLYKLCYYTTPFEAQGQLAILNASFKFPGYPVFTDRIKALIAHCLREDPDQRPSIYQVMKNVCAMRNRPLMLKDIYSNRTESETRRNQRLPERDIGSASPGIIGAVQVEPSQPVVNIPDIVPMRRGRPTSSTHHAQNFAKPSPSPLRNVTTDPFAALDLTTPPSSTSTAAASSRFPAIEQFDLLQEPRGKVEFNSKPVPKDDLQQRVTERLADDAFASAVKTNPSSQKQTSSFTSVTKATANANKSQSTILQPSPRRTSVGSDSATVLSGEKIAQINQRKIYKFPPTDGTAASSAPSSGAEDFSRLSGPWIDSWSAGPNFDREDRSRENSLSDNNLKPEARPRSPVSSRPSLEGSRPSSLEVHNLTNRSKSANSRPRPSSVYVESNLDTLRDKAGSRRVNTDGQLVGQNFDAYPSSEFAVEDGNISSNVEYLRAIEGDDSGKRRSSRGSKHHKMSSLSSISLSGTKNKFAGKFGDAFRRFETSTNTQSSRSRSTSPDRARINSGGASGGPPLTPITGSVATGDRSDDDRLSTETDEIPQETKRELERRRLSQEERRVAAAGAEYKQRLASRDDSAQSATSLNRAATIQNKVQSLLDESNKKSPMPRQADGYGRFTDQYQRGSGGEEDHSSAPSSTNPSRPASVNRKPIPPPKDDPLPARSSSSSASFAARSSSLAYSKPRQAIPLTQTVYQQQQQQRPGNIQTQGMPPSAPPKPAMLRKRGGTEDLAGTSPSPTATKPSHLAGRPINQAGQYATGPGDAGGDDWEADFSKRFPSLSGLDMVERDIGKMVSKGQ